MTRVEPSPDPTAATTAISGPRPATTTIATSGARGVRTTIAAPGALGVGIGWRPEIAGYVDSLPGLRFTEVVAESVPRTGAVPAALAALRDRGVCVVPHG